MYENLLKLIQQAETADRIGKIENVVGMSMEASGGHDKRMNDCLPPILFSAIFKLLKVLPDTELDAC